MNKSSLDIASLGAWVTAFGLLLAGLCSLSAAPQRATAAPVAQAIYLPLVSGDSHTFRYGLQAHLIPYNQAERSMITTLYLGFDWMKQQIEWKEIEPSAGYMHWGVMDEIVDLADENGLHLLFSVVHAPGWARETNFDAAVDGPPADPQMLARALGALADRYCGHALRAIEVWNEQNLASEWGNRPLIPADYLALLEPAYQSIKANCPQMLVISGGLTPAATSSGQAEDDFDYLEAMLEAGLVRVADGIGAHPSGYNVPPSVPWQEACAAIQAHGNAFNGPCDAPHHSWSFRSTLEGYHELLARHDAGYKQLWATEYGWAAGGAFDPDYRYADDNDFQEQADWTVEALHMMQEWGWVDAAFLWNLNFRVVRNRTQMAQWGIVANNWSPLPVFHALKHIAPTDVSTEVVAAYAHLMSSPDQISTPALPVPVPEPVSLVLYALGAGGLALFARRKRRR